VQTDMQTDIDMDTDMDMDIRIKSVYIGALCSRDQSINNSF